MDIISINNTVTEESKKTKAKTFVSAARAGGVLDISLGGEMWPGPSYPDPV